MGDNTPFGAVSSYGAGIAHLFGISIIMCCCILAIVAGLVAYACFKYRARANIQPKQIHGNKYFESAWIIAPLLLLVCMFVVTAITTADTDPAVPSARQKTPDVIIVGHQWWWEFRYPKTDAVTSYEIHLSTGEKMAAQLKAFDVIHDFSVNKLGRKMDVIPGYVNWLWLDVNTPGVYQGFCNEYCGEQHAWMQFKVIAQKPADFQAWLNHESSPAVEPVTDQAKYGQKLFLNDTCADCHEVRGTSANADVGPDLTHFASRTYLGSGVLPNNPQNLFAWLKNPQNIKPGVHMPDMQLNDPDTHALVAYLESLK